MSELNVAAKTRMIAKGLFSSGDERRAHAVNCAADEIDKLTETAKHQQETIDELEKLAYEFISTLKSIGNDCGAEDTKDFVDNLLSKLKNEACDE